MPGLHTTEDVENAKQEAEKVINDLAELNTIAKEYLKWFTGELQDDTNGLDDVMDIVSAHWGSATFLADVTMLIHLVGLSVSAMPKKANLGVKLARSVYVGEYLHQYLKYKHGQANN